ncbi:MAG TPA: hypothetical protein VL588_03295 [Bdellovibrionota bacterium]|jgi:hypothetical protein|nr:hypothetical protein [Bdellovibrionota bacterium]
MRSNRRLAIGLVLALGFVGWGCAPAGPSPLPMAGSTVFPQTVANPKAGSPYTMPSGGTITQLNAQDFGVLQGSYQGSLYYMYDQQAYTVSISSRTYNGQNYPFVELQSQGTLGNISFAAYMEISQYPTTLVPGDTTYILSSSIIPANLVEHWVDSDIALGLILSVKTLPGGGKQFDPTQSVIYIMDCAFSVGVNSCSTQYDYQTAGFLNDFRKR